MIDTLMVIQGVISVLLVILVLIQFGKGAEMGATWGGGGASQAVFTSSQQGNIFSKATGILAALFLINSVFLSLLISRQSKKSIFDGEAPVAAPLNSDAAKAPVAPAPVDTTAPAAMPEPAPAAPTK